MNDIPERLARDPTPLSIPGPTGRPAKAEQASRRWLWASASAILGIASLLPLLEASKASQGLGPCALVFLAGLAIAARRPLGWKSAALGLCLAGAGAWIGWRLGSEAMGAWQGLDGALAASALARARALAFWSACASLGLALFLNAPKFLAWAGAVACAGSLAMMALGVAKPW